MGADDNLKILLSNSLSENEMEWLFYRVFGYVESISDIIFGIQCKGKVLNRFSAKKKTPCIPALCEFYVLTWNSG